MQRPLADEIRPKTLDEVVGQRHLLAPGAVLRRLIESGTEANMVFYGPSGTGKTTIANIVAERTHKALYRLNATTATLQDVKDIIGDVGTLLAPGGVLLYLDEIQYFNKKQQQSLSLPDGLGNTEEDQRDQQGNAPYRQRLLPVFARVNDKPLFVPPGQPLLIFHGWSLSFQ